MVVALVLLPFSLYMSSPGGHAFAAMTFASALFVSCRGSEMTLLIVHGLPPSKGSSARWLGRFEHLAWICNLLSSLYNHGASPTVAPYWDEQFKDLGQRLELPFASVLTTRLYTMGSLVDIPPYIPDYIRHGYGFSRMGLLVFVGAWSLLPFLISHHYMPPAQQHLAHLCSGCCVSGPSFTFSSSPTSWTMPLVGGC